MNRPSVSAIKQLTPALRSKCSPTDITAVLLDHASHISPQCSDSVGIKTKRDRLIRLTASFLEHERTQLILDGCLLRNSRSFFSVNRSTGGPTMESRSEGFESNRCAYMAKSRSAPFQREREPT